jgi:dihydrolipoamide dehydrogenase
LEKVPYLTSDQALFLKKQPKSLVIFGGGYISCELAHFFGALGTKVMILQRSEVLLTNEDRDISKRFTDVFRKKHDVLLSSEIVSVSKARNGVTVDCKVAGKRKKVTGEQLLVATGRVSNADKLDVAKSGIKTTDKGGYVQVNEYLETNVPGIWAIGDIAGKYFFKHSANLEAAYAAHNAFNPKSKSPVDYTAMPHAVFSSPQIAGVGATEQELQAKGVAYIKSIYKYDDSAMGFAIEDHDGFVKVLVDPKTRKILGCHIIGTEASVLIHEVIPLMRAGLGASAITQAIHIHPALSEVVQRAFNSLE